MKTVLDAVIAFKGDCDYMDAHTFIFLGRDGEFLVDGQANASLRNKKMFVCTGDKASALVDELASSFGKCDISYQEHCENETIRLEGDEMKTVTHEGNVYQIGAVYGFSDDGDSWLLGTLGDCTTKETNGTKYPFQCEHDSNVEWFRLIRLQQAPIGTITKAPVELVDGECYQFTAPSGIVRKGYFIPVKRLFICADGNIDVDRCTNIKLLTVA